MQVCEAFFESHFRAALREIRSDNSMLRSPVVLGA